MISLKILFLIPTLIISVFQQATTQQAHLPASWYPNKKETLQATLTDYAKKAAQQYAATLDHSAIRAIIAPHAGYAYSGTVAASVYRLLASEAINKVIILAPDHTVSFAGVALPTFDTYQTPLGTIDVDTATVQQLTKNTLFHKNSAVFGTEHSLEVQLPFIQTYLPQVTIIPLIIGSLTCAQARAVAQALKPVITDDTLVIVTTDFIHYGPRFNFTPFKKHIPDNIRRLDSQAVTYIEQGACAPFAHFIKQTKATICGHYPLEIFLSLLELNAFGAVEPRFIAYDTSGQQEKNYAHSVSYIGMLFTQEKLADLPIEQQLTQQEQRALLQEAQDVLYNLFDSKVPQELLYPITSFGLTRPHGAFTTLETKTKQGKQLRGCIGRVITEEPLYKTVATVMRDTALHDTRFLPVEKRELPELAVKVSVLSSARPIASYNDIIVGKHGVILRQNNKSALFLPEVPVEFNWNLEEMLEQISKKAGLPGNAWRNKETRFSVFSTLDIQ